MTERASWRRTGLVAAALLLALVAVGCASEPTQVRVDAPIDRGPDDLPDGITVVTEGEVRGAPDTLSVDFGVSVKRPNVQTAVDDAAAKANAIVTAVRAQGVEDRDVQTRDYRIQQEFRYPQNGEPIPDGYRVSNIMNVRIHDLTRAGAIIDAVSAAGGDDTVVHSVSFSLEDDDAAQAAAREDAMTKAKAKASQLAELGDRRLGPAQAISDAPLTPRPITFSGEQARAYAAADAGTPISPGEVTSTVTLRVRFVLE